MKVVNTEEMQQYVACVNTWKSKPEVFRMAEEVDVGGIEDESGSPEESRSGNEKQASFLFVPVHNFFGIPESSRVVVEPPRPRTALTLLEVQGQRLVSP